MSINSELRAFPQVYVLASSEKRVKYIDTGLPIPMLVEFTTTLLLNVLSKGYVERTKNKVAILNSLIPVVVEKAETLKFSEIERKDIGKLFIRAYNLLSLDSKGISEQMRILTDARKDSDTIIFTINNPNIIGDKLEAFEDLMKVKKLPDNIKFEVAKIFEERNYKIQRKIVYDSLLALVNALEKVIIKGKGNIPEHRKGRSKGVIFINLGEGQSDFINIKRVGHVGVSNLLGILAEVDNKGENGVITLTREETDNTRRSLLLSMFRMITEINNKKITEKIDSEINKGKYSIRNSINYDFVPETEDILSSFTLERVEEEKRDKYRVDILFTSSKNHLSIAKLEIRKELTTLMS